MFSRFIRLKPAVTMVGSALLILMIYIGFLLSYRWLDQAHPSAADADLSTDTETVVVIDVQELRTVNNRLDAEVVVLPAKSTLDAYGLLRADMAVRLTPSPEFGMRRYARGTIPTATDDSLVASGNAQTWPFDVYKTGHLRAEAMVSDDKGWHSVPVRVEVIGSLGGWRLNKSVGTAPGEEGTGTTVTLERARGTLAFDVGICLVLISMPSMALFVAIETVRGVKRFHPPLTTWFGTMLFAVVPLRNILPGAPPPGAWIDRALVLWVLIALVVAMVLYVEAWWKQSD